MSSRDTIQERVSGEVTMPLAIKVKFSGVSSFEVESVDVGEDGDAIVVPYDHW